MKINPRRRLAELRVLLSRAVGEGRLRFAMHVLLALLLLLARVNPPASAASAPQLDAPPRPPPAAVSSPPARPGPPLSASPTLRVNPSPSLPLPMSAPPSHIYTQRALRLESVLLPTTAVDLGSAGKFGLTLYHELLPRQLLEVNLEAEPVDLAERARMAVSQRQNRPH